MEKNKEFITRARLMYRFFHSGEERTITIGHIELYVGDLIKNWEKYVKKVFNKTYKEKRDDEIIEYWAKKDFYVRYVVDKQNKLDMLTKEGIFRPRELLYSDIVLEIIEENEPLAKLGSKMTYRS